MRNILNQKASLTMSILTIFLIVSCNNLEKNKKNQLPPQSNWINFEWYGDTISGRYFDKLAINLPFSIEGIPHAFTSQFDLGATSTIVYGNAIKPYLEEYPVISQKLDTINKEHWLQGKNVGAFKNIHFKLDTVSFTDQVLVHFDGFGDELTKDSIKTTSIKHIGTVGSNIFQNKYLIIDFSKNRISVLDSLSTPFNKKITFVDVKLDHGRIKVPVTIDSVTRYFMFDTGSSMFPLSVTKENVKLVSTSLAANDTLMISTWGEFYEVHGYNINANISIGTFKIETKNLNVYDSKEEFKQFYEQEDIMGIMGNSFFLDKIIVIDYVNKKFGIVN